MESTKTSTGLISPREAATLLGVSESSIKRWCDQGRLELVKTPGGHRRLRLESVQRLAREGGQPISPADFGAPAEGVGPARALLRRSLLTGDETAVLSAFERAHAAAGGMAELADDVIAPVLADLGARWARGAVQIYEERRACELLSRALARLSERLVSAARPALSAIGGSLPGDPFTLPNVLAELVLRESGLAARSLGSGLPAEAIERAIEQLRPQLVWVSVGFAVDEREVLSGCERLHHAASAHGASLILGGRGLPQSVRRRLRYAAYCETMTGLRELTFALTRVAR